MSSFTEDEYKLLCKKAWDSLQKEATCHRGLVDERLREELSDAIDYQHILRDNYLPYVDKYELSYASCENELKRAGIDDSEVPEDVRERFAQDLLKLSYQSVTEKIKDIELGLKRDPNENQTATANQRIQPQRDEVKYSKLFERFTNYKIKEGISKDALEDNKRVNRDIEYFFGDRDVSSISKKEIKEFLDLCLKLPMRNKSPYRGISSEKAFEVARTISLDSKDRVAPKTVSSIKKLLQGVFKFAVDEEVINVSPVSDLGMAKLNKEENPRAKFSDTSLAKIYSGLMALSDSEVDKARKWIVLIAIYSGARLGEIYGLRGCDLIQDEDSGIYYFNHNENSGATKSNNAERITPVHSKLIELGVLKIFDASSSERVFSAITDSKKITQWFNRFRDACGVNKQDAQGNSQTFHCFRHTFVTKVRSAGVAEYLLQQCVGHAKTNAGLTDKYSSGSSVSQLKDAVEAFVF